MTNKPPPLPVASHRPREEAEIAHNRRRFFMKGGFEIEFFQKPPPTFFGLSGLSGLFSP
jgi:hypothetical protein